MLRFSSFSVALKPHLFSKNYELVLSPYEATEILLWAQRAQIRSYFSDISLPSHPRTFFKYASLQSTLHRPLSFCRWLTELRKREELVSISTWRYILVHKRPGLLGRWISLPYITCSRPPPSLAE